MQWEARKGRRERKGKRKGFFDCSECFDPNSDLQIYVVAVDLFFFGFNFLLKCWYLFKKKIKRENMTVLCQKKAYFSLFSLQASDGHRVGGPFICWGFDSQHFYLYMN